MRADWDQFQDDMVFAVRLPVGGDAGAVVPPLNCYRVFATADADLAPDLGAIAVRALAVTGEDDPGSTPEMTRRLAAALPDCRAEIISRARHIYDELLDGVSERARTIVIGAPWTRRPSWAHWPSRTSATRSPGTSTSAATRAPAC
ncbi:alpha/beta fold hydrolase [Streptomyces sp. NPDC002623]